MLVFQLGLRFGNFPGSLINKKIQLFILRLDLFRNTAKGHAKQLHRAFIITLEDIA